MNMTMIEIVRRKPLDLEKIKQILAEMREGLTEQDLDEIDGAMNVEYIEPLDTEA